jgi:hypothetical protein
MARKQETYLILDTETGGDFDAPVVYDLGYVIINRKGERLTEFQSCVKEIITNPNIMMRAFYAKKIFSHYLPNLSKGTMSISDWSDILWCLKTDIKQYNVKTICAYNAKFDFRAIKTTNELLNVGQFFDKPIRTLCLWESACTMLMNNRNYRETALALGWITPKGNIRTSAEMIFRYLQNDFTFSESHTALADAQIESIILEECFKTKKALPFNFSGKTWQEVNNYV